jgi:hypothetical protein
VLLPGINDEHGTGAILTGIASQRWDWGKLHLNAQIALTRERHADYFFDAITEGPHDWVVRPVSEIFYERDIGMLRTLRGALVNDHTVGQIRADVTFAFRRDERAGCLVGRFRHTAPRKSLIPNAPE